MHGKATQALRASPAWHRAGVALALLCASVATPAWVLTVTPGTRAIFLQVGNGSKDANNTTLNEVSVSVPAVQLGTGVAQAMTSNSTAANSFYDGFAVCNPPNQVYVGGYLRMPTALGTAATLRVTTPSSLINENGDAIAFSTIGWTSTANGASNAADIPAGTFVNGGSLTLRNIGVNSWVENCLTFSYSNAAVVPSGTYTGRAVYTLTAP